MQGLICGFLLYLGLASDFALDYQLVKVATSTKLNLLPAVLHS